MTTEENLCNLTFNHGKKVKKAHKSVLALCCNKITNDSPNEYFLSINAFNLLYYLFQFAYNNIEPTTVTDGLKEIARIVGCKALQNYRPPKWSETKRGSVKYVKQPQVKKVKLCLIIQ